MTTKKTTPDVPQANNYISGGHIENKAAPVSPEASAALAEHEAEKAQAVDEQPFAWATYDGEGSYDLRLFVDNEDYKDEFIKRNPRYASWVIPLYERPAAPDAVCMGRDELINMLDDLVPLLQSHVRSVRDWREQHAAAAAPASVSEAPVAAPLTDELTGKLMRIHAALGKMGKKYGEIGSRDVDVARWNADLYEAIAAVGGVLADQPLEQLARIKLEGGQG